MIRCDFNVNISWTCMHEINSYNKLASLILPFFLLSFLWKNRCWLDLIALFVTLMRLNDPLTRNESTPPMSIQALIHVASSRTIRSHVCDRADNGFRPPTGCRCTLQAHMHNFALWTQPFPNEMPAKQKEIKRDSANPNRMYTLLMLNRKSAHFSRTFSNVMWNGLNVSQWQTACMGNIIYVLQARQTEISSERCSLLIETLHENSISTV